MTQDKTEATNPLRAASDDPLPVSPGAKFVAADHFMRLHNAIAGVRLWPVWAVVLVAITVVGTVEPAKLAKLPSLALWLSIGFLVGYWMDRAMFLFARVHYPLNAARGAMEAATNEMQIARDLMELGGVTDKKEVARIESEARMAAERARSYRAEGVEMFRITALYQLRRAAIIAVSIAGTVVLACWGN